MSSSNIFSITSTTTLTKYVTATDAWGSFGPGQDNNLRASYITIYGNYVYYILLYLTQSPPQHAGTGSIFKILVDANNPNETTQLSIDSSMNKIAVNSNYICAIDTNGNVWRRNNPTVSITDPWSQFLHASNISDIAINDSILFMVNMANNISYVNISDTSNPVIPFNTDTSATQISITDSKLYGLNTAANNSIWKYSLL